MGYTYEQAVESFRVTKYLFYVNGYRNETDRPYPEDCLCEREFGPGWRLADWEDLKRLYNDLGEEEFVRFLKDHLKVVSVYDYYKNLPPEERPKHNRNVRVTRNGSLSRGNRYYFFTFLNRDRSWTCGQDGFPWGGCYLVEDELGDYLVVLGSWYGCYPLLCKKVADTTEYSCKNDSNFKEPLYFLYPPSPSLQRWYSPEKREWIIIEVPRRPCIGDPDHPLFTPDEAIAQLISDCKVNAKINPVLVETWKKNDFYADQVITTPSKALCLTAIWVDLNLPEDYIKDFLSLEHLKKLRSGKYFIEAIAYSILHKAYPRKKLEPIFKKLWNDSCGYAEICNQIIDTCSQDYKKLLLITCEEISEDIFTTQYTKRFVPNIKIKVKNSILTTGLPGVTYLVGYPKAFKLGGGHPETYAEVSVENSIIRPLNFAYSQDPQTMIPVDPTWVVVASSTLLRRGGALKPDYVVVPHYRKYRIENSIYTQRYINLYPHSLPEKGIDFTDWINYNYLGFSKGIYPELDQILRVVQSVFTSSYAPLSYRNYKYWMHRAKDDNAKIPNDLISREKPNISMGSDLPISLDIGLIMNFTFDGKPVDLVGKYQAEWYGNEKYVSGPRNKQAAYFDGNSYIKITPELNLLKESITIFMSFYVERYKPAPTDFLTQNALLCLTTKECDNANGLTIFLQTKNVVPNGGLLAAVCESGLTLATKPLPTKEWLTLAITSDGNITKFYLNNVLAGIWENNLPIKESQIVLGADIDFWAPKDKMINDFFIGAISNYRIYNRELSNQELTILDQYYRQKI